MTSALTYRALFVRKAITMKDVFRAKGAALIVSLGQAPQDPRNKKTSALKTRLIESRFQRSHWYDQIPGAMPQAVGEIAPLALKTHLIGTALNKTP
jgi:hypothetical protein